ncbi:MAG: ATP-binding protein [Planctomycetota bacterium]
MPTPDPIQPDAPLPGAVRVRVRDDRDRIAMVEDEMMLLIEQAGFSRASKFAIKLAFEEAVTNAFAHGHKGLAGDLEVTVEYAISPEAVTIAVQDQGPGFSPDAVPDPTLDENLDKPSGRGLMLIRTYMSEAMHNSSGNRLVMRYDRPAGER